MTTVLPTEVWRMSWTHASFSDLKSLSSSCRLFRDISQPFLFRALTYGASEFFHPITSHNIDSTLGRLRRNESRLRSLASDPRLALMVQSWTFHSSPEILYNIPGVPFLEEFPQVVELSRTINSDFASTLGVFANLSSLSFTGFDLTAEFCQTLASLPRLKEMKLALCDIHCTALNGGLALEDFSFSNPELLEWEDALVERHNLVSPSRLKRLRLIDPLAGRLFLSVFTLSGPLPRLVSLHLALGDDHEDKDIFYKFLDCCPALERLDLDAPITFAGVKLPDTTVPALRSFTGPIELAGTFAGGRPLRSFHLEYEGGEEEVGEGYPTIDNSSMQAVLLQMSTSSATLEEITLPLLPLDTSNFRVISDLFPKLKRLVFFLRDTAAPPEGADNLDEAIGNPWGLDDELDEAGFDDHGVADEGADDPNEGWMPLSSFLGAQQHAPVAGGDLDDLDEPHCEDYCDDDCDGDSTSDASDAAEVPEVEDDVYQGKTYEDLKLDSLKDFMRSLENDTTPLPRNLRHLGVALVPSAAKPIPDAEIVPVVEKLGARYPALRKFMFGFSPRAWKRKDGVWKHPKAEEPMAFHPFRIMLGSLPFPGPGVFPPGPFPGPGP
ncbi:hypothetical protein B0H16DRAFT_601517 [Mycena metata]|uniref:F-box domain-containing protein n=1 Tax=Mycena metata TaxID=1033252 RepID=A0AAD7K932_9AGAR|nr:hypothetical protein B0H16DRAFT_601517 [Mycena metata]